MCLADNICNQSISIINIVVFVGLDLSHQIDHLKTTQKSSSTGNELMADTDDLNTEEQSPVPDYRNDHSRYLLVFRYSRNFNNI